MKKFSQFLKEDWEPTARFHADLNPTIWDGERLRPHIREKLLEFASAWGAFAKIPGNLVQDVLLVGGSAGYNYTDKSDLDVHLLIDRNMLGKRSIVDELLQTKKSLWGLQHHVTVAGLPVEGYAQDISEGHPKSQGVYSIKNDVWITKPEHPPVVDASSPSFKAKVQKYIDQIDHLINNSADLNSFGVLKDRLKDLRSAGLARGGEYDQNNIIFKTLRDLGTLDKMTNYVRDFQDRKLSG